MNVDRNVELDRGCEQTVVARMIEEAALRGAVDERTRKAQVLDRARELGDAKPA